MQAYLCANLRQMALGFCAVFFYARDQNEFIWSKRLLENDRFSIHDA